MPVVTAKMAVFGVAARIAAGALGYGGYRHYDLVQALNQKTERLAATESELHTRGQELDATRHEKKDLEEALERERTTNASFEDQIRKIGKTVGTLEKLSKTDPELLQKYAKVYFLNENYLPAELADIPKDYLYDKPMEFHAKALPHLQDRQKQNFYDMEQREIDAYLVDIFD